MTIDVFRIEVVRLWEEYRSSKHPFFHGLKYAPTHIVQSSAFLNEFYKRYQGAMHASRTMAYYMPHLDAIELRMIKLKVLADDDGAPNGDSHHYQLRRSWTHLLGRPPSMNDDDFGDLNQLIKILDPATAKFVSLCKELYPQSLGPWIMIEGLAHGWIGALQDSLSPHFPDIGKTDYFRENYASKVEIRHADESLKTTMKVLAKCPQFTEKTLQDAKKIGKGLNTFWQGLATLLTEIS